MVRLMLLLIIVVILVVPTATAQDAETMPSIVAMAWTTDVKIYLFEGGDVTTVFAQSSIALPGDPVWSQDGQHHCISGKYPSG